ncbi:deoxynucleoside kinase [Tunturiibacter lichenicola]|uniref:deoxynucleoside kinase n=1 Tax=Tunturiibacter lichenicola TaxID=2051959 RepID=UPI003D9B22CB
MLISFEGPIAAGKTTLAHLYSAHATGRLVLEEFTTNQFLEDFYADNDRWSLQMQLWFLLDRHTQLRALANEENDLLVADYAFIKNEIFAQMLLTGRDQLLFGRVVQALGSDILSPELYIYLDASNDVLLNRIAGRGRAYESHINGDYLNRLRKAYDSNLDTRSGREVIHFDTSTLDLNSKEQLNAMFEFIDKWRLEQSEHLSELTV